MQREENQVRLRQLDTACRRLCNDFREESAVLKTLVRELSEAPTEMLGNTFVAQVSLFVAAIINLLPLSHDILSIRFGYEQLQAKVEEIFSVRMTTFRQENERLNDENQAQLRKRMEDDMAQRASTYQSELEENELEIGQLNEKIDSKEEEIKNLNLQLSEYERNVTKLQAELARSKSSSDDLMKSNEAVIVILGRNACKHFVMKSLLCTWQMYHQRVQSIQENLEAQRLEIEKLEKDREDLIMGKMRDISALEDQIEQLHIQHDSERRRANSLMDELSRIKKVCWVNQRNSVDKSLANFTLSLSLSHTHTQRKNFVFSRSCRLKKVRSFQYSTQN